MATPLMFMTRSLASDLFQMRRQQPHPEMPVGRPNLRPQHRLVTHSPASPIGTCRHEHARSVLLG